MIVRLSLMKLLEFVAFGSWFATLGLARKNHPLGVTTSSLRARKFLGDQATLPFWDLSADSTACRAVFFAGSRCWG